MLFDLRSRGRRRTVQTVYIGLAVLIGLGLVGFGVGTGSGGGGIFGAFSNSSSSNPQGAVSNQQTKAALKQTRLHPSSPSAWSQLVQARFEAANSTGYNANTGTYTTAGKKQLVYVAQAYQHYAKLTSKPNADTANLAARAYGQLGQYNNAASAWQDVSQSDPTDIKGLACTAMMSYAAKNDRVGQLAETQYLAKIPKAQRKSVKSQIEAAKAQPSVAAQSC